MVALTSETKLVRLPDIVASEMDGDLVMMSIEHGQYFGISGVGARVWELIEQPTTLKEITATVLSEFDVDEEVCRKDLLSFAAALLDHKVAKVC